MEEEGNSGRNPEASEFVPFTLPTPKLKYEELPTTFPGTFGDLNLVTPGGIYVFKASPSEKKWTSYAKVLDREILPVLKHSAAVMILDNTVVLTGGLYPSMREAVPVAQTKRIFIKTEWGRRSESLDDLPDMLEARYLHSSVFYKGKVMVIGGQSRVDGYLNTCEALEERSWSSVPALNVPRSCATAIVHNQSIYVVGGYSAKGEIAVGLEIFIEDGWMLLKQEEKLGVGVGLIFQSDTLLIVGGSDGESPQFFIREFHYDSGELTTRAQTLKFARARPLCCQGGWVFFGGWPDAERIEGSSSERFTNPFALEVYDSVVFPSFTKFVPS
eukprot:CAMPEP_0204919650 /NCGR_PEP_ID=MMETSP1397-20131031/16940_1 /ASSEMBLY_ACC=CAM_ASM_000891 /TAXON_ID=49980 /ORGANISM="Climacostomum Climacostomum virens, Strain Stock W-24" /LENGTH=328 /DNA_ID=CAMNT_0052093263 /DNA_START=931 /DNA_END=1920 /DNA_ORIENTATION=-